MVFDLDDTLYNEREFVDSGFQAVASFLSERVNGCHFDRLVELYEAGETRVFQRVLSECPCDVSVETLLGIYRDHQPRLRLQPAISLLLTELVEKDHRLGIITDGRSTTQRNKIEALGLTQWFNDIAISEEIGCEKPSPTAFLQFQQRFASNSMAYVGDNPAKDFLAPNRLGWLTVCVRARATNVHAQDLASLPEAYHPAYWIDRLADAVEK